MWHYIVGFFLEEFFCLYDVIFFKTLMADYDHFLHSNTLFNWLLCSIMSAGSRKCMFWTSHLRFSTRKPPVNIGHSRFSKTFSSFDHLVFTQEIVWKPSVTSPFYLSHVWKLLVPLSPPFSVTVYKSNVKLQQRHLWPVFNINENAPTHPMLWLGTFWQLVQNLLFPSPADMIQQGNQLKRVLECKKWS